MIKEIDLFRDSDAYSLSMFLLYKLVDDSKYSTLSELAYILDKKSLIDLCEYFGGLTIKIPTLEEIRSILAILMVYQRVNVDNIPYEQALKESEYKLNNTTKTREIYKRVSEVLKQYDIKARRSSDD